MEKIKDVVIFIIVFIIALYIVISDTNLTLTKYE